MKQYQKPEGGMADALESTLDLAEKLDKQLTETFDKEKEIKKTAAAITTVSVKIKRTLAKFDEIDRLKLPTTSASSKKKTEEAGTVGAFSQRLKEFLSQGAEKFSGNIRHILNQTGEAGKKALTTVGDIWKVLMGDETAFQKLGSMVGLVAGKWQEAAKAAEEYYQKTGENAFLSSDSASMAGNLTTLAEKWGNLRIAAGTALEGIRSQWGNLDGWFKADVGNRMIDGANGMLSGIVGGINAVLEKVSKIHLTIPDWVPIFGGKKLNFPVSPITFPGIPKLASGAVLPANRPFLAVVGDQKNGTNVEAPLETIKQAVAEVVGSGSRDVVIRFTGDLAQLARVLRPAMEAESRRVGGAMIRKEVM